MDFVLEYMPAGSQEWTPLDLDGDSSIAMTYEVCAVGDLKNRRATWSHEITLPATRRNLLLLGCPNAPDVVAQAAYTPRPCRLFIEGALVSPSSSVLYISNVDYTRGGISAQIVSVVKDLFTAMAEDMESAPAHESWTGKVWNSAAIAGQSTPLLWPLVSAVKGVDALSLPVSSVDKNQIQIVELVPCYNLMTFVRELLDLYGYDVESDLPIDSPGTSFVQQLYITLPKITAPAAPAVEATLNDLSVPARAPMTAAFDITQAEELAGSSVAAEIVTLYYYAPQAGEYEIALHVAGYSWGGHSFGFQVDLHKNDGSTEQVASDSIVLPNTEISLSPKPYSCKMNIGEYLEVKINNPVDNSAGHSVANITINITAAPGETMPGVGSTFNVAEALGMKNYAEFLKAFLQLFAATIDVAVPAKDGQRGLVRIYTFAELYKRRSNGEALDWTRKMIPDSASTRFSLDGYGQNTTIALKANEDDGTADRITLRSNNKTLPGEVQLFALAFEAGRKVPFVNVTRNTAPGRETNPKPNVPSVPTLEASTDDSGEVTLKYKGGVPRIVNIDSAAGSFELSNATGYRQRSRTTPLSLPVAAHVPFAFFRQYYAPVEKMLTNSRVLTARFLLTAADIAGLDLMTPVYLDMYGAYFYINKISNFGADATTEVELIKL